MEALKEGQRCSLSYIDKMHIDIYVIYRHICILSYIFLYTSLYIHASGFSKKSLFSFPPFSPGFLVLIQLTVA